MSEVDHGPRTGAVAFEIAVAVAALVALVLVAVVGDGWPPFRLVVAFAVALVVAENSVVDLPTKAGVSPAFMLVMAAIAALDGEGAPVVLGGALVGASGGLVLDTLRSRSYLRAAFNCGQYLLSATAAGVAFVAVSDRGLIAQAVLAALAFVVVNVGLVMPAVSLVHHVKPRDVWRDMRPSIPNYFFFGLLGVVVGALGVLALVLLVIPVVIARMAFSAYLEVRQAHEAAVKAFVKAIEAKDPYTGGHSERVARYAVYMGEELGYSPERLDHLHAAALMHDIGKLAVPRVLLNKPGRLTEDEYALVQRHNHVCTELLGKVEFMRSLTLVATDRYGHFDAAPEGERDRPDAMDAFIVAVADAFDAMTSTRAYRKALPQATAFDELRDKGGTQFDPRCTRALERAFERRGERVGAGYEKSVVDFKVAPPTVGVGSAGLGDLLHDAAGPAAG